MSAPKSVEAIAARRAKVRARVLEGMTIKAISDELGLRYGTVRNDVAAMVSGGLVVPPRAVAPNRRATRLFGQGILRGHIASVLLALTAEEYAVVAMIAAQRGTVADALLHATREAIKAGLPLHRKSR